MLQVSAMVLAIVFWVILFAVLVLAAATGMRIYEDMKRQSRSHSNNPILELKRRFDTGELTREEFEKAIRDELKHPHRKAG